MAFAAGALVFPGGPDRRRRSSATAALFGSDAARVAAIRETIEETGLAPGLVPPPDAGVAAALRAGLDAEAPFAPLLDAHGLAIDGEALIPFARWCPNFRETRRFDTIFFLAEAPADAPAPAASAREAVRAFWASAADILAEVEAGRAHVIFPTRRNLERLARFASFAEARADARAPPRRRGSRPGSRSAMARRTSASPKASAIR